MGGWTEASFVGDDARKVFEHLSALKADTGEQENPPFNTYYNGGESENGGYEWSVRGSRNMNGILLDGLRDAIKAVGATGWFTSQGDCFPFDNANYKHGDKVVEAKGTWERLNMEDGCIDETALPNPCAYAGVELSPGFEPADGTMADEIEEWLRENRFLGAAGEGANFIALCKELSAMIKKGTVTVSDIQCEAESYNMDVMVGVKNEVMWRSWEGEGQSDDDENEDEEGDSEEEEEEKDDESRGAGGQGGEEAAEAAAEKNEEATKAAAAVPVAPRRSKRLKTGP